MSTLKDDTIISLYSLCKMRGYDSETGIPKRAVLEKLGLKDVADKLAEFNVDSLERRN